MASSAILARLAGPVDRRVASGLARVFWVARAPLSSLNHAMSRSLCGADALNPNTRKARNPYTHQLSNVETLAPPPSPSQCTRLGGLWFTGRVKPYPFCRVPILSLWVWFRGIKLAMGLSGKPGDINAHAKGPVEAPLPQFTWARRNRHA